VTSWQPTPALVRACLLGLGGVSLGVVLGQEVLAVLCAPFVLLAAAGLAAHPRRRPRVTARLDHSRLHEGQGTTSRLEVDDVAGVEHVTRVAARTAHVASAPTYGAVGSLVGDGLPTVGFSPRRWGRRAVGAERVALTSHWAGWRWGPVHLPETVLLVLPRAAPYGSRAEVPQPDGLVGRHRSRRVGTGTEFEGIRHFATGDRLKRINWPVSLRTGELHVVTGDRVGMLVVAAHGTRVPLGSGPRHLQRLLGTLSRIRTDPRSSPPERLDLGTESGSAVHVLSPMLSTPLVTATASLQRGGTSVVVVDTLGGALTARDDADRLALPSLAMRMQKIERDDRLRRLAALGAPVVPWRGPGTLDTVLQRLARRAQVPRVRA
jgi:uncharacterized protein (DUF58 family)